LPNHGFLWCHDTWTTFGSLTVHRFIFNIPNVFVARGSGSLVGAQRCTAATLQADGALACQRHRVRLAAYTIALAGGLYLAFHAIGWRAASTAPRCLCHLYQVAADQRTGLGMGGVSGLGRTYRLGARRLVWRMTWRHLADLLAFYDADIKQQHARLDGSSSLATPLCGFFGMVAPSSRVLDA
jgi:hypothetical protein